MPFPPQSRADWEQLLPKFKTSAEELRWEAEPGITLEALYDKAEQTLPGAALPVATAEAPRKWLSVAPVAVAEAAAANQIAVKALKHGAEGVWFQLNETLAPEALLKNIWLDSCLLYFSGSAKVLGQLKEQLPVLFDTNGYNYKNAQLHFLPEEGGIIFDPSESHVGGLAAALAQAEKLLANKPQQLLVVAKGHNSYFRQIAALRALRWLLQQQAKLAGADTNMHILLETAPTGELEQQLLANTGQAMSAVVGGADALAVTPHKDTAAKAWFAQRIALNNNFLLREEGLLHRTANPAAGSYYIEQLTYQLAEAAWQRFTGE